MQTLVLDGSMFEFGNSISVGILFPYLLKKTGKYKIRLYSKIELPEHVWSQFCDEYVLTNIHRKERAIDEKNTIENLVNEEMKKKAITFDMIESIPFASKNRVIKEKYVVFIPVVYGWHDEYVHWRTTHALEFDLWMKLKEYVNSKGYKVVGFGTDHCCSESQLNSISDYPMWRDMGGSDLRYINKMLYPQLEMMSHAATSVSVGGAFHIPMTFSLPGMGWDGQVNNNFGHFSPILSYKRTDLHYFPSMHLLERHFGLTPGKDLPDHRPIQELIYRLIITKLEQIL